MQYYNSQGDATHRGLHPGKLPVGCVIEYLEELCVSRPSAGGLGNHPCLPWVDPPAANRVPVSPFPAFGGCCLFSLFSVKKAEMVVWWPQMKSTLHPDETWVLARPPRGPFVQPSLLASRSEPWASGHCAGPPVLDRPENGEESHFHGKEFEWITVYNAILLRVVIFLRITKIKIVSITIVCPVPKVVLTLDWKDASHQGYQDFISSLCLAILHIVTTLEVSKKAVWATKKKSTLFSKDWFIKKK